MSDQPSIPQHVAIIMDGNGRWATRRHHPRVFGHIRGASRVKEVVREANRTGIKALTLYAFSTENWMRPETELSVLWRLLKKFLLQEQAELHRGGARLRVIGELSRLDPELRSVIDGATQLTQHNTGLQLTFCVSYGSRRELVAASQAFAADCAAGKRRPEEMTEALMEEYLWTGGLGELAQVDLVIRTSGEKRVSNFLLWQAAYAEFIFLDICWPDFGPTDLQAALLEYARRDRRYGDLKAPRKDQARLSVESTVSVAVQAGVV